MISLVPIRKGDKFQAKIPEMVSRQEEDIEQKEDDVKYLCWRPSHKITDKQLDEYISYAKDKHKYTEEQALGMLYFYKHDLSKTKQNLGMFIPTKKDYEFTEKEEGLFEQAVGVHGINFSKIQEVLPHKSIKGLVAFYFKWNKHEDQIISTEESAESAIKPVPPVASTSNNAKGCTNCHARCEVFYTEMVLCLTCFVYWDNAGGEHRPVKKNNRRRKSARKPCAPKGMNLDTEAVRHITTTPPQPKKVHFRKIAAAKRKIQKTKQETELLRGELAKGGPGHLKRRV